VDSINILFQVTHTDLRLLSSGCNSFGVSRETALRTLSIDTARSLLIGAIYNCLEWSVSSALCCMYCIVSEQLDLPSGIEASSDGCIAVQLTLKSCVHYAPVLTCTNSQSTIMRYLPVFMHSGHHT